MTPLSTIRHDAIFDPIKHKDLRVTLIGAGATGSRLWLALIELGITNLVVYDFDTVESHNLANQIYFDSHIGQPKVEALRDYYCMKTGANPSDTMKFYNHKVTHETYLAPTDYLFLMTDTIESRKNIVTELLYPLHSTGCNPKCVIETRMASTHGNVATFGKGSVCRWFEGLPDEDAPEETTACGASISVGVTASGIASHAVWAFLNLLESPSQSDAYAMHNLFFNPLLVASNNPVKDTEPEKCAEVPEAADLREVLGLAEPAGTVQETPEAVEETSFESSPTAVQDVLPDETNVVHAIPAEQPNQDTQQMEASHGS